MALLKRILPTFCPKARERNDNNTLMATARFACSSLLKNLIKCMQSGKTQKKAHLGSAKSARHCASSSICRLSLSIPLCLYSTLFYSILFHSIPFYFLLFSLSPSLSRPVSLSSKLTASSHTCSSPRSRSVCLSIWTTGDSSQIKNTFQMNGT